MAWTKILPSADSANRIPRGFSSVTIYSFKFILNVDEDDIATTLRTSLRLLNPTFPLPPNTRPFPFPDPIKSDGGDRSRAPKPEICWRRCAMVDWSENVDGGSCYDGTWRLWAENEAADEQEGVRNKWSTWIHMGPAFSWKCLAFLFTYDVTRVLDF